MTPGNQTPPPDATEARPATTVQSEVQRIRAEKAARNQIHAETAATKAQAKKGVTIGPWITVGIGASLLILAMLPQQTGQVQFMGQGDPIEVDCTDSRWSDHDACNQSKAGFVVFGLILLGAGFFWRYSRLNS